MRTGDTLIRLAKHKVDSVQKLIAAAEQTRAGVVQKLADLQAKAAKEEANAARDPSLMGHWTNYARVVAGQRANLDASIAGMDQQIEALRLDLQSAFEDQKKFEMLEERRLARIKSSKDKREQAFMDETALVRANRVA
jgi:flagellar protein FliJ